MTIDPQLNRAISAVPAGAWGVGVSGGADSVALLALLRARSDLCVHVIHLDHQTRGAASTGDAEFVQKLAGQWNLPSTVAPRSEIEPAIPDLPPNASAKYRAVRLALFQRAVLQQNLQGVILAHHADDQAETILQRLLRGSGYAGLAGMSPRMTIGQLLILRPLLSVRRDILRRFLAERNARWREDASNQSSEYFRNRVRQELSAHPALIDEFLALGSASAQLRDWARSTAPVLEPSFRMKDLAMLPKILANESARQWLIDRGVPIERIDPGTIEQVIEMAADAASPPRADLPGGVRLQRRRGIVSVE